MKRAFITFSFGYNNDELSKILLKSINTFSRFYDLKIYTPLDFEDDLDYKNPDFWKSSYCYIYKVLSCLKSLETFDEVVWLDTDIIATHNIDKIWDKFKDLEDYPLLPKERFANFNIYDIHQVPEDTENDYFKKISTFFGIDYDIKNRYLMACCMIFNRKSTNFFSEVLKNFERYDKEIMLYGDESIINGLLWQKQKKNNLGNVFICSQYFNYSLKNYITLEAPEDYCKIFSKKSNDNIFYDVLFFHGQKELKISNFLLNNLIKYKTDMKDLSEIMKINGSDKSTRHNYTQMYSMLFDKYKNKSINIFELGIGTNNVNIPCNMTANGVPSASLRSWKEYFPNANIFAADIDENILINEERISTFHCDQLSTDSIKKLWNQDELKDREFEIIILDGMHSFEANILFLENSIHKVKANGYLIIEDIYYTEVQVYKNKIKELEFTYPDFDITFFDLHQYDKKIDDNTLLILYKKF